MLIADYLKLPFPAEDPRGEFRSPRLAALDRLTTAAPGDPVAAIAAALPTTDDARRRAELVEALRLFPGQPAADVCVTALADPSAEVREQAINRLWLLSRKVEKTADSRERRSPGAAPIVAGLLPHLLKAADDASPSNRTAALYALADTLDPQAVARLRKGIADPDADVRFIAASLLSEFDDASGLPALKAELARLRAARDRDDGVRFLHAGRLIASFERLTGKTFGPTPINPVLSSDTRTAARSEAETDRLLEAWSAWWSWQPPKN